MIFEGTFIKSGKTPTHVGDSLKKPATRDKIQPLSFERVGPKNGQLRVIGLEYLVVPSRIGKY
jgi:hypothetical protein